MTFVSCSVEERFVNPLFEVFDGGDFILSSYRDVEAPRAEMRIYFEDSACAPSAIAALRQALEVVGCDAEITVGEIADEDWKFAYRRHFKTEKIGASLLTVPEWEFDAQLLASNYPDRVPIVLDPGMAFGTGKHETTKACLEFIDEILASSTRIASFLDMGCGSGILSIAAAKLGVSLVEGFDVDQEAVDASIENAEKNEVRVAYSKFALGRPNPRAPQHPYDLVVANILGPLLIRFADEIKSYVGDKLVLSGILTELYPEVRAAYEARGFRELATKTLGEWTTGLFTRTGLL